MEDANALYHLQVATRLPDGSQATDLTSFSWPCSVHSCSSSKFCSRGKSR